jgi:hypothetical protein
LSTIRWPTNTGRFIVALKSLHPESEIKRRCGDLRYRQAHE